MTRVDAPSCLHIAVRLHKREAHEGELHKREPKYPAKTHARKVRKELAVSDPLSSSDGLIYLAGQQTADYEDTDGEMPFRQRRYAYYLSGADFPGCAVTYQMASDTLTLWIPIRSPEQVVWYGALPSLEECAARSHVDFVKDIAGLADYIKGALTSTSTLYILHPSQTPPSPGEYGPASGFAVDHTTLQPAMNLARATKSLYEIEQIRRANCISSEAHRYVQRNIKSLTNEAQVENLFIAKCRELGAKKQAYPLIAGSGPNAAVLHYTDNDQDLGGRQLLVLDAGAEFGCYASDITRTIPLSGSFSPEAGAVYSVVAEMQDACISMIRPGAHWTDITRRANLVALAGLQRLGIVRTPPGAGAGAGAPVPLGVVRPFFMHGLGHLVGLDTHDVIDGVHIRGGGDGDDRFSPPLAEGMVITCEPGLYFNRAYVAWSLAARPDLAAHVDARRLEPYFAVGGCRLEDCILVTAGGHENLTTAPKGEEMLRVINGG